MASEPADRHDALVLDLDTRGGLAIARALGAAGLRVGVAARDGAASGMRTRYALERLTLPAPERDFDACCDALAAYLERQPSDTAIPSIDASVAALDARRERLERVTAPAICARPALEIALSKSRTLEVAAALGVAAPRSLPVRTQAEAAGAAAELGYPVVLKPDESWNERGGGGVRLNPVWIADAGELARAAEGVLTEGASALVQEVAPGARETVKLFRHRGRFVARLVMSVDRSWPPLGGSSVMRATVAPPPGLVAAAERLVAAIGVDGYSEVEFRRDRGGRPLLMEVNPRLSQSVELAVRAGVDFPRMQLEWARGGTVVPVSRYAIGVRVGWLAGEGRLLASALAGGPRPRPRAGAAARAIARDYLLRRASLEGLDRRDLRPTLAALAFTGAAATRRLRRPGTRRPSGSPG